MTFRSDFVTIEKLGFGAVLEGNYAEAEKYFQQFGSTPDKLQSGLAQNLDRSAQQFPYQ